MMIHRYSISRKFTKERSVGNHETKIAGSKGMLSVYIVVLFFCMAIFWYTVVIPVLSANVIIGHEVDRLPVAHCELNPIEMAWSQVKGHVKQNNKRYINIVIDIVIVWHLFRFTLTEVKELVYQGFEAVTSERWQSLIKHVQEEVGRSLLGTGWPS